MTTEETVQNKEENPLKKFYRAPKLYVTLPSGGRFNDIGEKAANGEIPVYAMTAKDEIIMRNPDALLNGDAVMKVLKSCVPDVMDVRNLPVCDVDILLIAVRMATHGSILQTKLKSPYGEKKEEDYDINLEGIIEDVKPLPAENSVVLKNGCSIYVKPFSYTIQTRLNLMAYDQAKALRNVNDLTSESAKQFTALFTQLADTNMDVLVQSVDKITTPDGTSVVNKKQIKDFMDSIESTDHRKVDLLIESLNKASTTVKRKFKCKETGSEFESEVRLDPSDFFVST
tara:strand:+ start:7832 stop:8686 length:855 start_codon:yes stop_codon:yes gene_type:complete